LLAPLGSAEVGASFTDTVYVDESGDVNVEAEASYHLQITGAGSGPNAAFALVQYDIRGTTGTLGPGTYFDQVEKSADGSYYGNLTVDFTIDGCPCSYFYALTGGAEAVNNSTATFFAQSAASTPEPRSFWLVGIGVLAIGRMPRQSALRSYKPMSLDR